MNGNLSTVEELSRASSVVSRGLGSSGGIVNAGSTSAASATRDIFSVTSTDSQYEFDAENPGKFAAVSSGGGRGVSTSSAEPTWRKSVTSVDDGVTFPTRDLPTNISGFGSPHKRHLLSAKAAAVVTEAGLRRDSFGNMAPGRVANLRAGFEGGKR